MEYKAVYKCRLCGEVFTITGTTERKTANDTLVAACLGIVHTDPLAPQIYDIHDCKGNYAGSLGLSDFQGWKADPGHAVPADMDDHTVSGLLEED